MKARSLLASAVATCALASGPVAVSAAAAAVAASASSDAASSASSSVPALPEVAGNADATRRVLAQTKEERQRIIDERRLAIDFYDDDEDECYDADEDKHGKCDLERFPRCGNDELICYNRTNRRDKFYSDWHPRFYINYRRVLCYPASWEGWGGCSSCSPGRYCKHEQRCILDEATYCCEGEWGCDDGDNDEDEDEDEDEE